MPPYLPPSCRTFISSSAQMVALSTFQAPPKTLQFTLPEILSSIPRRQSVFIGNPTSPSPSSYPSFPILTWKSLSRFSRFGHISAGGSNSTMSDDSKNYEFSDGSSEVELRLKLDARNVQSPKDIFVSTDDSSLTVNVRFSGTPTTLVETNNLYAKIKPAETIWYLDEDQLVVSLKKRDPDLKWPDIVETWESLTEGVVQYLKGTSIYLVGGSTEINENVSRELAVGLGYTPLNTRELLETFAKKTIDSWVADEGPNSIADAESAVFESLSSHVRTVVGTLGGNVGAAGRADKWRHLFAGFTVWLSQSDITDERKQLQDGRAFAYSKAEVTVKLGSWDGVNAKNAAQASLSALKELILSEKKLSDKKSLYVRLGCRGEWPNIKVPGLDPSTAGADFPSALG